MCIFLSLKLRSFASHVLWASGRQFTQNSTVGLKTSFSFSWISLFQIPDQILQGDDLSNWTHTQKPNQNHFLPCTEQLVHEVCTNQKWSSILLSGAFAWLLWICCSFAVNSADFSCSSLCSTVRHKFRYETCSFKDIQLTLTEPFSQELPTQLVSQMKISAEPSTNISRWKWYWSLL